MQLSDNFWLSECGRSSTAERCGIENTPPEWAIPKLKLVAENVLQPIRDHFKVPISFNGVLISGVLTPLFLTFSTSNLT